MLSAPVSRTQAERKQVLAMTHKEDIEKMVARATAKDGRILSLDMDGKWVGERRLSVLQL